MLCREIIAAYPKIHTKHISALYGQKVEFLNVKPVVHKVTTGLWRQMRLVWLINYKLCLEGFE
jgi:hypothetical protein